MAPCELNLLDLPDEVLINIFQNFEHYDLLGASNVCMRFEGIAQDAFPKLFNGSFDDKFFDIHADYPEHWRRFLDKFRESIVALRIHFTPSSARIEECSVFKMIGDSCPSLTHLIIGGQAGNALDMMDLASLVPHVICLKLNNVSCLNAQRWAFTHHPHLTTIGMSNTPGFDKDHIVQLVRCNSQLKLLHFVNDQASSLIELLTGKLSRFKLLELGESDDYIKIDSTVDGIESLTFSVLHTNTTSSLFLSNLQTIASECKPIKRLNISIDFDVAGLDSILDAISVFVEIESLTLHGFNLKLAWIVNLMQRFPKLNTLDLKIIRHDIFTRNDVLFLFTEFPNLINFSLSDQSLYGEIWLPFEMQFYHRFLDIVRDRNATHKFTLEKNRNKMLLCREKCIINGEMRHWMGYEIDRSRSQTHFLSLNQNCIAKIAEYLSEKDVSALYQTCILAKRVVSHRIEAYELHRNRKLLSRFCGRKTFRRRIRRKNADNSNVSP